MDLEHLIWALAVVFYREVGCEFGATASVLGTPWQVKIIAGRVSHRSFPCRAGSGHLGVYSGVRDGGVARTVDGSRWRDDNEDKDTGLR